MIARIKQELEKNIKKLNKIAIQEGLFLTMLKIQNYLLIQYLNPVGLGPSLKTCPK